jgi:non-specific protein-tyrosine kinase
LDKQTLLDNHCIGIEPDAAELDSYKVLRTKIQQMTREKGWNTIMVTSPRAGDGKTLTAVNLALTFSKAYNQTVLLVDCDLQHQRIRQVMGFKSEFGLIDYLLEDRPLDRLIVWPGIEKLTLISGGRTITESTELLGSPKMQALLAEMKTRYDDRYVILDVPPVLEGADALALMPYVDCIVMLVAEGKTSFKDVRKAVELIPAEKFLGFVMNRQKAAKKKKR